MLESIEKLRKMDADNLVAMGDGEYVRDTRHDRIADEIEREIAERYMELPVDADGVPIHVGDEVAYDYQGISLVKSETVKWINFSESETHITTSFSSYTKPDILRHRIKPRTIEDVLESFIEDYDHWDEFAHFGRGESRNALFARYADEIRKVVGE